MRHAGFTGEVITQRQITDLLNAFEARRPADRHGQRPIWNRKRTRTLLRAIKLTPIQERKGCKIFYSVEELRKLQPLLADGLTCGSAPAQDEQLGRAA
jgi:hypothetical protein